MDAVVNPAFASVLARLGGLAVLNLAGVQTCYDDPDALLERIACESDGDVQRLLFRDVRRADSRRPSRAAYRGDACGA